MLPLVVVIVAPAMMSLMAGAATGLSIGLVGSKVAQVQGCGDLAPERA